MKKAYQSSLLSASIDDIICDSPVVYEYFITRVCQMKTISVCIKRHLYPYQSRYLRHYTVVIKDT